MSFWRFYEPLRVMGMRRFFHLLLGAMAMVAVALLSAFLAMRLAIHGREVKVPDLTRQTLAEASRRASATGLRLRLENKYYSPDTPAGEVLAQFPSAGAVVRREWPVRVTESLGTQQVSIPGLIGQGERSASIRLRQLGLELGTVGHIPAQDAAGTAGVVIAQSPLANATGVDSPRVSILVSDPPADDNGAAAYVMPSLTGLSLSAAYARAAAIGLHVASIEDVPVPAAAVISRVPIIRVHGPSPTVVSPETVVVAQTPLAGHRVSKGDDIHLTLAHGHI